MTSQQIHRRLRAELRSPERRALLPTFMRQTGVLSATRPTSRRMGTMVGMVLIAVAIGAFYLWTASSNTVVFQWRGNQGDYYNRLTHGFADGHLYMKVAPLGPTEKKTGDAVLGDMPFLLDASFYQGKYYLYFGPTPVMTAFLPYRLLTGGDVSDNFVAAAFASAAFLVSLLLFSAVRRKYFPAAPGWVSLVAVLVLGGGNACAIMLRHPMFYEAAIACAYFFHTVSLLGMFRSLHATTWSSRLRWLAVASLAYGLAVGARANFAPSALILVAVVVWLWSRERTWPVALRLAGAGFGPIALCAVGLLAYNYGRFGNVLEFGVTYQFTYKPIFRPAFIPYNLKLYYFSLPELSWYFPFAMPIDEGVRPPGYVGFEHVHGEVWSMPLFFVALGVGFWLWRTRRSRSGALPLWYGCVLGALGLNLVILLCLGGRANRYMVDFQPSLLLLGVVGCGLIVQQLRGTSGRKWLSFAVVPWAILIVQHNVFSGLQLYDLLKQSNPPVYHRLASVFNEPTLWAGRWLYPRLGPLRMKVTFAEGVPGHVEPIVVTGSFGYADFLSIRYLGNQEIRFELGHQGYQEMVGEPLKVIPGTPHEMEVEMGSLYPPASHPFFAIFSRSERSLVTRTVRVTLDGREVFSTLHELYDASPGRVYVGRNPVPSLYAEPRFSGTITDVRREGLASLQAPRRSEHLGPVALKVKLPPDMEQRGPEPLVVTGEPGRSDGVFIIYEGPRHVRFAVDHWELGHARSDPIEVDPAVPHRIEIWMGSLFPPIDDPKMVALPSYLRTQLKNSTRVTLDGREVFIARGPSHDAPPQTLNLGANTAGLSSSAALFTGDILNYGRPPAMGVPTPEVMRPQMGVVRLALKFPAGRVGLSEPLLAVGKKGQGDTMFVTYVDPRTVRFAYEHQGTAVVASAPVSVDYGQEHIVDIDFGALHPMDPGVEQVLGARAENPVSRLRVELDGHNVVSADVNHYPSVDAAMTVGENSLGAPSGERTFSGLIYRIERPSPPVASVDRKLLDYGPVHFRLVFPNGKTGLAEPLIVTGHTGAADALIVRYLDRGHLQFQWDHWGFAGAISAPVAVDYERTHEIEVEMGSFYPVDTASLAGQLLPEEIARKRNQITVRLDGAEVFSAKGAFHPTTTAELAIGANSIGLSSAAPEFTGAIEQFSRPGVAAK